jgi:stage V sporulation protein AD
MKNRIIELKDRIYFRSYGAVGGYEEKRGPLGDKFDFCDESDKFGQNTWELAEGEMGRISLNIALNKVKISQTDVDFLIAGDLQNQCVASSVGLSSFGIPYLGVYGACSTCTEALLLSAALLQDEKFKIGAAVTSSHNSAAERQFRTPLEYGGQRTGTAQWTATAAASFILSRENHNESDEGENLIKNDNMQEKPSEIVTDKKDKTKDTRIEKSALFSPAIEEFMIGKIVSGETTDATNMGAAMAFAAADSIITYFRESGKSPTDFDFIFTGDLGKVGSNVLRDILEKENPLLAKKHQDCGLLLYDKNKQDVHSGASGCGTSASVLAAHILPEIECGNIKNILFLSTGALMSPSSILQKQPIYGIAPLIKISSKM